MNDKRFTQLIDSVREGGASLRGEKEPTRRFEIAMTFHTQPVLEAGFSVISTAGVWEKNVCRGDNRMKLEQLQLEIEMLPEEAYAELRQWFAERDWERWDRQLIEDEASGNQTRFLFEEAMVAKQQDTLRGWRECTAPESWSFLVGARRFEPSYASG
ncbi:MAG: hypothetical protein R2856_07080 [Caldilineaceae bacterium]